MEMLELKSAGRVQRVDRVDAGPASRRPASRQDDMLGQSAIGQGIVLKGVFNACHSTAAACVKAARARSNPSRTGVSCRALFGLLLMLCGPGGQCAPGAAQSADASPPIIRNYGPADGFSQNAVNAIVQGRDGYLCASPIPEATACSIWPR